MVVTSPTCLAVGVTVVIAAKVLSRHLVLQSVTKWVRVRVQLNFICLVARVSPTPQLSA